MLAKRPLLSYLKNNYQIKGEAESDLDIKHQRMEKILKII